MRDLGAMAETTGMAGDDALPHLQDLRIRLVRIALLHRQGAVAGVVHELRALKHAAHAWHFDALEDLAHVLEAEIGVTGSAALVGAYVECMEDAIACGAAGPLASETMFAAIRARMLS